MSHRMTMQKIADLAGVDKAVVSKIINHASTIPASQEKIARVRAIISAHHYVPTRAAQSLATHRTHQLAFLLSDHTQSLYANGVFAQLLTGVVRACQQFHYECQTDFCDFLNIHDFVMPENFRNRSLDGCILAGSLRDEVLEKICDIRLPVVVLGGVRIRQRVPVISRDSLKERGLFIDYAMRHGHRIMWIGENTGSAKHDYAILGQSHPEMTVQLMDFPHDNEITYAKQTAKRYFSLPAKQRPTLIFASDVFCCVFARELSQQGLSCPKHISLMCFSDTEMAACYNPALTVYAEQHETVGYLGAKLLIEILESKISSEEAVMAAQALTVNSRLIERDSIRTLSQTTKE